MREIKFRAWDKDNKSWIYSDHIYGMAWFWKMVEDYNCEVMQYTGLKDKNGIEIYEGDIVKYVLDGETFTMDVEFVFQDNLTGYDLTDKDESEIIGNIYENPELLEENK